MPLAGLTGRTLYQIVHLHAGGQRVRLRFSNIYGDEDLTLTSVFLGRPHPLGLPLRGSPPVHVSFGERETVTIQPGSEIVSDPVEFRVDAFEDLAISFVVADGDIATGHFRALQNSFVSVPAAGNAITEVEHFLPDDPLLATSWWPTTLGKFLPTYSLSTTSWWSLNAVEVSSTEPSNTIVAFGDSTTDGVGSTVSANRRYPDLLARRLASTESTAARTVLNAGIGFNELLTTRSPAAGNAALQRFEQDVLGQLNVTEVIVQIGINDLQHDRHAEEIIEGLQTLAASARAYKVRTAASTILPGSYTVEQADQWRAVNRWMRNEGAEYFDRVIDLAVTLADPHDETRIYPAYDCGDGVHPNDAGYERIADVIAESLLKEASTRPDRSRRRSA
jgi:lysophospholipase L1-like esterase